MGSGSTGVACLKSNRKFVGFEIDENYYQIATDRFVSEKGEEKRKEKGYEQNSLFGEQM
jgi:site-specific DNA-methyltransferase (adenine-specific)